MEPHGFQAIAVLSKRSGTQGKLLLDADNASHYAAKSSIEFCAKPDRRVAPYPPYSPNLAPSDYCRFGYNKDKPKSLPFPSALHLHGAITQTVQSIDQSALMATFGQWIVRVE
jgi:hypothetical protein